MFILHDMHKNVNIDEKQKLFSCYFVVYVIRCFRGKLPIRQFSAIFLKGEKTMRTKRIVAALMALLMIVCLVPFTAFAADAQVLEMGGQRIALVSGFGKMNYEGKSYAPLTRLS